MNLWIENNLETSGEPKDLGKLHKYDIVINVSDIHNIGIQRWMMHHTKTYFWFPLNEFTTDMGLNSIFGAMEILWLAEQDNKKVLLYCAAGVCRSITVYDAYYFIRNKKHTIRPPLNKDELSVMFKDEIPEVAKFNVVELAYRNMLLQQCLLGHLPSVSKMEDFLTDVGYKFNEPRNFGKLDSIKLKYFK